MKINEIFLSIQGEGIETGLLTIFIRTSGCNLKCSWCDTNHNKNNEMSIEDVLKKCKKLKIKRVCITGGEPLIQKKQTLQLIKELNKKKYEIILETNGSLPLKDIPYTKFSLDIKCPASNQNHKMLYSNLKHLTKKDQVKFIIKNKTDYDFSKKIIKNYNLTNKTNIIFQPVYNSKFQLIENIIKDKLNIRFGVQLQKIYKNGFK